MRQYDIRLRKSIHAQEPSSDFCGDQSKIDRFLIAASQEYLMWRKTDIKNSHGFHKKGARLEVIFSCCKVVSMDTRYDCTQLISFATKLMLEAGMEAEKAIDVANILIEGDLMGHTTHGL